MHRLLSTEDSLPFHAYRKRGLEPCTFAKGPPELYASIEHWYQSEKFRGVDEGFRLHLMSLPSPREVRKAALKRDAEISEDWIRRQNRIMAAGIWMKAAEHPDFKKLIVEATSFETAYTFNDHYWGSARPGVSVGFYAKLLSWIQRRMIKGPKTLGVVGSKAFANPQLLHSKLDVLFDRGEPNEVVCGLGTGIDEFTESWALNRYIPVRHNHGLNSMHLHERLAAYERMASEVTHLVIIRQDHLDGFEILVKTAFDRGIPVRLIDLDSSGKQVAKRRANIKK